MDALRSDGAGAAEEVEGGRRRGPRPSTPPAPKPRVAGRRRARDAELANLNHALGECSMNCASRG